MHFFPVSKFAREETRALFKVHFVCVCVCIEGFICARLIFFLFSALPFAPRTERKACPVTSVCVCVAVCIQNGKNVEYVIRTSCRALLSRENRERE